MDKITDRTGEIHSSRCGELKIIRFVKTKDCTVQFLETGTIVEHVMYSNILKGNIKDPFYPSIHGVAYFGIGEYSARSNRKLYSLWKGMLERCYDPIKLAKWPSYKGCTVVKRWHNFQVFCADIIKMKNWDTPGFELDKDWRLDGNKKYGPKYCSFVPRLINSLGRNNPKSTLPTGVQRTRSGNYEVFLSMYNRKKFLGTYSSVKKASQAYLRARCSYLLTLANKYRKQLHVDVYQNLLAHAGQ